jgi:hypothetical protein
MTAATLRGQLTHVAELATLPGHTFGVLPFAVPCPVQPSGFQLYDRDLVVVETLAGVLELTEPDAVGPIRPPARPARGHGADRSGLAADDILTLSDLGVRRCLMPMSPKISL